MVKLHVEGGGNSKKQQIDCREAFRKLIQKAGFSRPHEPQITAWGGRDNTFSAFSKAVKYDRGVYHILLVDSEEPIEQGDEDPDSYLAWKHLKNQDGWDRPKETNADQSQLMVTCMETWIMADREAIKSVFAQK